MRHRLFVTIAAFSLTLSACGGDEDPVAGASTPTPSSSAPADAEAHTPSPTPPHATKATRHESVEAFAARWLRANRIMQNSGDPTAFKRLSAADCAPCDDLSSRVASIYANGGSVKFGGSTVKSISNRKSAGGLTSFDLTYVAGKTEIKESPDAAPSTLSGGEHLLSVTVRKSANGWRVVTFANYHS